MYRDVGQGHLSVDFAHVSSIDLMFRAALAVDFTIEAKETTEMNSFIALEPRHRNVD